MLSQGVLCSVLLLTSVHALAREPRGPDARVVEIHVDGDPQALVQTRAVAGEILPRISVIPVVIPDGAEPPAYAVATEPLMRAYFDFRSPAPRLVLVDSATHREIERRVLPEGATLETSVESVTHVLYMVVASYLEEARAKEAAARDEPTPKPPPRSPPPEKAHERPLGVEAGLVLRALYVGGEHVQPGAGAALDLRVDAVNPRISVAFQVSAHTPFELSYGRARLRLTPFVASLVPSLQAELGANTMGLLGVGASVSWFALSADVPLSATPATSTGGGEPAITAVAGCRFRVGRSMTLTLTGVLDFDLVQRLFVAQVDGRSQSIFDLPRVRPSLARTGAFSLFGPVAGHATGVD